MSAALRNQLHRWLTRPCVTRRAGAVEALSPGDGRDVAVLVQGFIFDKAQLLAQGRSSVGVGAVVEQQAGECGVLLQSAKIGLRHDAAEQWRVAAQAIRVE